VDFVLSNFVNSEIYSIYLLVQYKSQSLIEHIRNSWVLAPIIPHHFVTVVPPQMQEGQDWFQGTADAVYQNLDLLRVYTPTLVAVFGADHVYRMDVRQMVDFHRERRADVTVAALPVPIETANAFGIVGCSADGRVQSFVEKPAEAPPLPGDRTRAYASMGNYLFNADVLAAVLRNSHGRGDTDFGRDVMPRLVRACRLFAYDFSENRVPGARRYEEHAYWRDVGTIDAYFAANMDLLGAQPRFDLFNPRWPIRSSSDQGPAVNILDGRVERSQIGTGAVIQDAVVRDSVIRREVLIEEDADIEECIIMDYCEIRKGARLRRAIVDRYNSIGPGEAVGYDSGADRKRFHVTDSGIIVVPMAPVRPSTTLYE
jgi:glucose-1-phosphate adenylyltransferase